MKRASRYLAGAIAAAAALVLAAGAAQSAENGVKSLQEALAQINLEQQALFQQFQMIEQLRRMNLEVVPSRGSSGAPELYDDVVAAKKEQADREEGYRRELRELFQRYRDLERQKQPIMDSLRQARQAAPPAPAPKGGSDQETRDDSRREQRP
jgi:hypothetical protein